MVALCETIRFPFGSKPETGLRTRAVARRCGAKGAGVHGTRYATRPIINSKSSLLNSNAGRRFDTDTGLYYYRARYYNPYIGRFLQTDPIGYGDGMNMYAYCGNNSLSWVDPYGMEAGLDFTLDASSSGWRFTVTVISGSETAEIYGPETIWDAIHILRNLDSLFTDEWMKKQDGWKLSGENEELFWILQVINKLGGGFDYGALEEFGVTIDWQPFLDAFPDDLWDEWTICGQGDGK